MAAVIIVCLISCASMITLTLIKPSIKLKKINISTYWLATLLGAVLLISFRLVGIKEVFDGLTSDAAINPLKILALFISMTVLSIFLDEVGFFKFLANAVVKRAGTNQIGLFTVFFIAISILTVFTSNDIIILTFTPFICYFAKNAKVNPIPYLVSEFVAANTASSLLIIGNPTNIYLATANGINFLDYLKVMALPTLFAVITAYFVMLLLFYKKLKTPINGCGEEIRIKQKSFLVLGIIFLSVCTILLAISDYIDIPMWIIAVSFALGLTAAILILCLIKRQRPKELGRTLKRAPYELIPFLISMFVMVLALEKYGVTEKIASLLGEKGTVFSYGIASVFFANLINNIPMSVLFSSVLSNLNAALLNRGIFAVIIGSNIGAFLTPIGALAGIMWLDILKKNDIKFSFFKFIKYGVIITIPTLAAALSGLALSLAMI